MPAQPTIAILATLDTKGQEAAYLAERIEDAGAKALLVDLGVVGEPGTPPGISRETIAEAGGTPLARILEHPTRQDAVPVMVAGATRIMCQAVTAGEVQGVIGLGGTQGTPTCTQVMRALPYGLPKIMVSTIASGDVAPFVDIKDITMMFSVGDILGLNPVTRMVLSNAAGAACGMVKNGLRLETVSGDKPLIGMTNLGVLTAGAMEAIDRFHEAGYEVIVFHAVGSGGRAMEQLMKEGVIGAVFDYALGEIADEMYGGLRAANAERLTVAGDLGLPQVICPGGAEHIGLMVDEPNVPPEKYRNHLYVFHNPVIFAPRLNSEEYAAVAMEIARRLTNTKGRAVMMLPLAGTSRYGVEDGPLHDPEGDRVFFETLKANLPESIEVVERDTHAEDPAFVAEAVERLISLIEAG
jgi:uncharacterized protein (UPF0261 family)